MNRRKVLKIGFFDRDTKIVAKELLGKFLVRKIGRRQFSAMITETEAYDGPHDKASHASKGKTERTKIMFGEPGKFYVYLVYGMYYMLNVVTREKDYPAAILIRGVKGFEGPGKLTKFFKIDKSFNGKVSAPVNNLWFEDRGEIKIKNQSASWRTKIKIKAMPRVGVSYAGPIWSAKKWRFCATINQ